jgi:hypothetical protein
VAIPEIKSNSWRSTNQLVDVVPRSISTHHEWGKGGGVIPAAYRGSSITLSALLHDVSG